MVHPSLYCVVYGTTQIHYGGEVFVADPLDPEESENALYLSQKFAWLPSEFSVEQSGEVRLLSSYINNLHKSNEDLYHVLPIILGYFIPMFERVLGAIDDTGTRREPMRMSAASDIPCVLSHDVMVEDEEAGANDYAAYPGESSMDRYTSWAISTQQLTLPDALGTYNGDLEDDFRISDLKGRELQCIVKLANIHLSPDKPTYPGGNWHVEGGFYI